MADFDQYGRIIRKASSVLPHYQADTSYDVHNFNTSSGSWWTPNDDEGGSAGPSRRNLPANLAW